MVHHKKWLVVGAAAAVALGCIGIVLAPNETAAVVTQIHVPTAPASKANITSAIVAAGTMLSAALIRSGDIDNAAAREANENAVVSIRDLMAERGLWIFTGSVVLFHFANAAMLPLVGELLSKGQDGRSSIYMSACIIAAQFVMIPVAFTTGNLADKWGRKPLFLIGFGVLAARGVLYTLGKGAPYLLVVQSLDGVGAAIFGVLWVIIISDLARGSGRFNLLQGVIQTALGVGAFLSNFLAGFVVKAFGFNTGFLSLAAIALAGTLLFAVFMPETLHYQPLWLGEVENKNPKEITV